MMAAPLLDNESEEQRLHLQAETVWSQHARRRFYSASTICARGGLAQQVQTPGTWRAWSLDFCASAGILRDLMMVPDTVLVLLSAIGSVLLFERWGQAMKANLSWTAVSFLLAFPLQNAIKSAYNRRDHAVQALCGFRAALLNVFQAHLDWDWPGANGWYCRQAVAPSKPCYKPLPHDHAVHLNALCLRIMEALQALLLVPRAGHPRLIFWRRCQQEQKQIDDAELAGRRQVLKLLRRLQLATEDLKVAGMPANEASRINQYNMQLTKEFEQLWACKTYQTPASLRAVLRILIQVLPFFYGPYWVHIAAGDDGQLTTAGLVFACGFSSMIALLLTAMMIVAEHLENPFRPQAFDTVPVEKEIDLCRIGLSDMSAEAEIRWQEHVSFEWEVLDVGQR
eukprot:TRINITY_DN54151_c0_g1_i1.p1 TRINITY_DN54151_c0_g1~~TRINITY_DN54151_c0_g1_i1.p1  ORF type:complete len:404 (-),score=90.41 TRINITY_DN54151_c0_g1_i1:42-1229(-)